METGLVTENKDLLLVRKTWSKFLVGQRELDLTDIQLSAHVVCCGVPDLELGAGEIVAVVVII